ncbi:Dihydrolipoyl dehydrogenase [Rickettsiales bacterium Ac37b]|nr:Dihydrolipoyl dehydrogenase [Rickettsiales bacterium Ac37b]
MTEKFDVVIIGSGPGGYVAAIRAAQLKMKVAVIEREHLGGVCLNWGCIPTKALLRSSEIHHLLHNVSDFGFSLSNITFDIKKIVERSRKVAAQLSSGIQHLLKKNKVTVFEGHGKLLGNNKVSIEKDGKSTEVSAPHIILATGARPRIVSPLEPDGKLIWTSKEAMIPETMPKSLLIVGSGAIGIEFASFYRNMGAEVTVVEMLDRILPAEDSEIAQIAHKAFVKQGMHILTSTTVKEVKKGKNNVTVTLNVEGKEQNITAERIIIAAGIVANTENLGLEQTKIKFDKGRIVTNDYLATDEPGVYAIGDIVGAPLLAHKASYEGIICIEKIAGLEVHKLKRANIPACTYCTPQIASIGLSEQQAKDAGYQVKIGRFPFVGNGKAVALGESEGLIKTIFDAKTGELLGAHMIGAEVTELIQGYAIAKNMEATELDIMHTIFPHPTLSEMMHESVLSAYEKAIHF